MGCSGSDTRSASYALAPTAFEALGCRRHRELCVRPRSFAPCRAFLCLTRAWSHSVSIRPSRAMELRAGWFCFRTRSTATGPGSPCCTHVRKLAGGKQRDPRRPRALSVGCLSSPCLCPRPRAQCTSRTCGWSATLDGGATTCQRIRRRRDPTAARRAAASDPGMACHCVRLGGRECCGGICGAHSGDPTVRALRTGACLSEERKKVLRSSQACL